MTTRDLTIWLTSAVLVSSAALGQAPATSASHAKARLIAIKDRYTAGSITTSALWQALSDLEFDGSLATLDRAQLAQMQAQLLFDDGYAVLPALYASAAVRNPPASGNAEMASAWRVLWEISKREPIQNILELIAKREIPGDVPYFGSDWNYFYGNYLESTDKLREAIAAYESVKLEDRHFLPAMFQKGVTHFRLRETEAAEKALTTGLTDIVQEKLTLPATSIVSLNNYSRLTLGRLYYGQQKFLPAIRQYRLVDRDSSLFYAALWEQAWAFFMAGYPNHALGSLHASTSPFFKEHFNPEQWLLTSMIYYWMCRFDDARTALADFIDRHAKDVDALEKYLSRKALTPQEGYELFENLIAGVREQSLPVSRAALNSAATADQLMFLRDQYATVLEERTRLRTRGIAKSRYGLSAAEDKLARWGDALKRDIGRAMIDELRTMKERFDLLRSQAEFLYLELLMSEKEHLLGRELHGDKKMAQVSQDLDVRGWGRDRQSWAASKKDEFWVDELGAYITRLDTQCNTQVK